MTPDWEKALALARAEAPFLAQALDRQQELAALLARGEGSAALRWARAAGENAPSAGVAMRRERLGFATALAIGDLAGAFDLDFVMQELSDLADRSLDRAIVSAISRRTGDAQPAGFIGLALGKLGARELNYSSDIDPILLYDPLTLPRRKRDEPGEAAQRYAREIVELLSQGTKEGYVFRVDLRLRPASEVSPLAISTEAALTHYESSALAWERAAFIRARAAAGDRQAGEDFLRAIRSFIWRRSLDYGAIEEIRQLTRRIRANYQGPQKPGAGYDLKAGRGGIREIEFFAQTHQLIHGGRNPDLRLRGTRAALDALAAAEIIGADEAVALGEAYDFLRRIEHRIQMVEDRQTHSLPDGEALASLARLCGFAGEAQLLEALSRQTSRVAALYDDLLEEGEAQAGGTLGPTQLTARLDKLGFSGADALSKRIAAWRDGRFRSLRSGAAQDAFDALLPSLLEALAAADDPDRALLYWERLLEQAPSAINLFRLLEARPAVLDQLTDILTLAPTLAEAIARRPALLDSLIDQTALDLPGSTGQIEQRLESGEARESYEAQLDRIRLVTGEIRFALGLQLIQHVNNPLDIAAALARTAEAGLRVAHRASCEAFEKNHGQIADSELVVLGLGRLGGGALTHASDLDLIYLHTGTSDAQSDGERALGASHYYNRLGQRLSAALSVPTAEGALYEVDTRLRPQGAQGPLVSNLASFAKYQREAAWSWEHMALARARVVVASPAARAELEQLIGAVLCKPRDGDQLRRDILSMREEIARHKPGGGPLDVKLARGGLVDLEFIVHFTQLREATGFDPDLRRAIAGLAEAGFVDSGMLKAHDLLTSALVSARLLAPDCELPPPAGAGALARACGFDAIGPLLEEIAQARRQIAKSWREAFDRELEIAG